MEVSSAVIFGVLAVCLPSDESLERFQDGLTKFIASVPELGRRIKRWHIDVSKVPIQLKIFKIHSLLCQEGISCHFNLDNWGCSCRCDQWDHTCCCSGCHACYERTERLKSSDPDDHRFGKTYRSGVYNQTVSMNGTEIPKKFVESRFPIGAKHVLLLTFDERASLRDIMMYPVKPCKRHRFMINGEVQLFVGRYSLTHSSLVLENPWCFSEIVHRIHSMDLMSLDFPLTEDQMPWYDTIMALHCIARESGALCFPSR